MSKKWMIIIAIVIILIIVNVAALQYTSTNEFCSDACHYMTPSGDSWEESEHYNFTKCMDCHSEPGMIGYLQAKMNGLKELYVHVTQDVTREDIEAMEVHVSNESCLQCHGNVMDDPNHQLHESMDCGDCHLGIGHGAEVDLIPCGDCHPEMANDQDIDEGVDEEDVEEEE